MELMKIVETLIDEINRKYKNDIAVMCVYGSYIYNATHDKSDIDFYFIPKTEKAYDIAQTFIIDDIGFDFWPMSWERAENIANYSQGFVSLIADAKVVWYGNQEDLQRFEDLRKKAKDPSIDVHSRIGELIEKCEHCYFEVCTAQNLSEQKIITVHFVEYMVELVALINHTYTHRGWKNSIKEVLSLKVIPNQFYNSCQQMLFATESKVIRNEMHDLILWAKQNFKVNHSYSSEYNVTFSGLYEEELSIYNKLYHACDINDGITAIMAGVSIQNEISEIMGQQNYCEFFNDIVSTFRADDLLSYKIMVKDHEKSLQKFLESNGVKINRYTSVEAFESAVK